MRHSLKVATIAIVLLASPLAFAEGAQPSGGGPAVNESVFATDQIQSVTAVTRVFGRGQRVVAAIVEFAAPIAPDAVNVGAFAIEGRTILAAHAAAELRLDAPTGQGRFVILSLDPDDAKAAIFAPGLDEAPEIVVQLVSKLTLVDGTTVAPGETGVINTRVANLIVDDFRQFRFVDPETGLTLAYNLFIPAGYNSAQPLPLVMFLQDAGVTGSNPLRTLEQGLGAVSFASPEDQSRHPAFVLAPQFPVALANDAGQTSVYVEMIPRLLAALSKDYPIDPDRIYATGQSGGCMTGIALGVANPDLFAGTLCVAGQWDPSVVAPLADDRFWAIVSEDDAKAFPGMTAIVKVLEENGAKVTRGSLDAKAGPRAQAEAVAAIRDQGKDSNVFFTTFVPGSVLPSGGADNPGAGHVNTWVYAYDIPAIRDWLFEQRR